MSASDSTELFKQSRHVAESILLLLLVSHLLLCVCLCECMCVCVSVFLCVCVGVLWYYEPSARLHLVI